MPKTPSSKLFDLVHSLSGSEKRYFKLFIKSKDAGHSKYAQLFDAIDAQEVFDDEELRLFIYGDEPVESRKYSELKAYLYDFILKSLQSYDEKSSIDFRLKNMLLGVRALFKRSRFDDTKELLRKVKKLAGDYEDFNTLIEILEWEKRIAYAQMDINFLDKEMDRITEEEKKYLNQLNNISAYRNIFFKILMNIRKGISRNENIIKEHEKLMAGPLMVDKKNASTYKSKVLFYRIKSLYYFSIADHRSFYEASTDLIEAMEENPRFFKEDVSEYISVLSNHAVSCGRFEKFGEVRETLDKLLKINPITADDALKIHRQYFNNKFRLCIVSGEFEEGLRELERHLKEMRKFNQEIFQKNTLYFQYFYIYFGNGDFEKALNYLNDWLGLSVGVERKDLESLARILNLIIHYELGNTMLLDSLIRSTQRFLTKENRLLELEKKFINFIREAGRPQSKGEIKKAFETLQSDFERLSQSPIYNIFDMFDLDAWLESKISSRTFAEVVKSKFLSRLKKSA